MIKSFDPPILNSIITNCVENLITTLGNLVSSKPCEIAVKSIEEYEDHMRVKATDKFDVAVYIAAVSFYSNQADIKSHRPKGAMVLYMDTEVADKIFKAAGLQVPYDEDDETMMVLCGKLCEMIVDKIKEGLAAAGYGILETSEIFTYKNTISEGIEFSKEQNEKQEISFYFLKHKALVIDWTMAPLPKK